MASISGSGDVQDLLQVAVFAAATSTEKGYVANTLGTNKYVVAYKGLDDAAAGTATPAGVFASLVGKWQVNSVKYVPSAALTANDTDYATITVSQFASGGSLTTVAQQTTKSTGGSGSWTARTAVTITLSGTAANLVIDGSSAPVYLAFAIAKAGSGVAVPAGCIEVYLTPVN